MPPLIDQDWANIHRAKKKCSNRFKWEKKNELMNVNMFFVFSCEQFFPSLKKQYRVKTRLKFENVQINFTLKKSRNNFCLCIFRFLMYIKDYFCLLETRFLSRLKHLFPLPVLLNHGPQTPAPNPRYYPIPL